MQSLQYLYSLPAVAAWSGVGRSTFNEGATFNRLEGCCWNVVRQGDSCGLGSFIVKN